MRRYQDVGPALKLLREEKGLTQEEVAVRFGRQAQSVSRLEQPSSNPKAETLLRYLTAIDADLDDLNRALRDPLVREIREDDERLRTDAPYRMLVRRILGEVGGPSPVPEVRAVLERIADQERRIERLEKRASPVADAITNGGDDG